MEKITSRPLKQYHETEREFDVKKFLETYFSPLAEPFIFEEIVIFPMTQLDKVLAPGRICGDHLVDITIGPTIFHLFPFCDLFKSITILEFNESSMKELKSWLNKDVDAFDWSHAAKFIAQLQGNRDDWNEKEEKLRKIIKDVLTFDLSKENPTDPVVLPKADCLLSAWGLDVTSKDKDAFAKNLIKISSLLKVGGHLIYVGALNLSYYHVGEQKFHGLTYDEKFLRKTLGDTGFIIESFNIIERKQYRKDTDFQHIVVVSALKTKEIKK